MKNLRTIFYGILFVAFFCVIHNAEARQCYTMQHAEAEQGIRIHSELMVIGLNCQHIYRSSNGENLYNEYKRFTNDHADLFEQYESRLLDFFRNSGATNPVAELNTLRTDFANKISNDAARTRPDLFCGYYAPRIEKARAMDRKTIRQWATTFYPSHPVSRPICR